MLAALQRFFGRETKTSLETSQSSLKQKTKVYIVDEDYPCVSADNLPFQKLNPIQSCFYQHYNKDNNCVVSAPTGTGKSGLIYMACRQYLNEGKKIIITAPTKKLVKDIYQSSLKIFGSKIVGLNTGNDKNTDDKYIIITTPEGYLSAVRSSKEWTAASLLIMDEAHTLFDVSRGPDMDTVMSVFIMNGGKVLLLSATFIRKEEVASFIGADIFDARYRRTQIIEHEILCPDDLKQQEDFNAKSKDRKTLLNPTSQRLDKLKSLLFQLQKQSTIIFVPTKEIGFALSKELNLPFHCADVSQDDLNKIEIGFNDGSIKHLLATTTLAVGVNTPADAVVMVGTRLGSSFMESHAVEQIKGRGGRGKDEAHFYLLGDEIEIFNIKNPISTKSVPVPVESMVLTMLSTKQCSKDNLVAAVASTFAASFVGKDKLAYMVDKYLNFLSACNLLNVSAGGYYHLTQEGVLLARYYIYPKQYIGYIKLARLLNKFELDEHTKGCVLMSYLFPEGKTQDCPGRLALDFKMRLNPVMATGETGITPEKAGLYSYFTKTPSAIPEFLGFKISDSSRWTGMLNDMQKYGVHKEAPGLKEINALIAQLRVSIAKAEAIKERKKGVGKTNVATKNTTASNVVPLPLAVNG